MTVVEGSSVSVTARPEIRSGMILVNRFGHVKILRSRTKDGSGWNCADGAGLDDAESTDPEKWTPYTPEALAADLRLARELHGMAGERELSGGLATWDACSGRRCVLPKLAKIVS